MGRILDAHDVTVKRKVRKRKPPHGRPFAACTAPNDVWCIDFKGWFRTGDGTQVDPFTMSDAYSRYCLCLEAVARTDEAHVWPLLAAAFRAHGLPRAIRSDNGPPFAGSGVAGLSRLAVKLIKAGVRPERIKPGKPQQNGRHERLHLTLQQDACSPPAETLEQQKQRFRAFREAARSPRPDPAGPGLAALRAGLEWAARLARLRRGRRGPQGPGQRRDQVARRHHLHLQSPAWRTGRPRAHRRGCLADQIRHHPARHHRVPCRPLENRQTRWWICG